ncbi:right-handed parallel beta-helix repeat-containing protein [Gaoshiqia sp. Z1-71]|uniref:right-handed parallel beta-helix repeat-containing protein n=1 Tax=Gaoshiqia hydrogeniformans TaxID=3290090 RepID=UPI003BF786B1
MKMRVFALLTLIALTFAVVSCSEKKTKSVQGGKTYYVSINGNDKNPGTQKKPLQTISAAALLAMPGDTVLVYEGIYRERVNPPRGGLSDDKRITYMAAPGQEVVITGSEVITGWEKLENDSWTVTVPNTLFGDFNPYIDLIRGDWFIDNGRSHHTGAVYLNGDWLMEAAVKDEVMRPAEKNSPLWWAEVNSSTTSIWAQFPDADPNHESVEINVRQTVFYPDEPFINYITVRGFIMQNAATNWAPPSAEQKGLIGTHWSKGWIIEDNIVRYSKCVGITLGKHGDEFDNTTANAAEGYVATIHRALDFGWNKETIGGHIVRNNTISHCEQAGMVGSMGCAFSTVDGNTIHDIHTHRLFGGYEMAGIKFHGGIDTRIINNHIFNVNMAIWLDWMSQGAQVESNLLHNNSLDIFLEVNHGPMLVSNNILLSPTSLLMNSSGAACVHNLIGGLLHVISFDSRLTPYHKPHSTEIAGMHDNPGGGIQFFNNLFINGGDASQYSRALLPVVFDGNVYTKGSVMATRGKGKKMEFGEMNEGAREQLSRYTEQDAVERNLLLAKDFDATVSLTQRDNEVYLEIALDKNWLEQNRYIITTASLSKAIVPDLPYENPDGSPVIINLDYFGNKRSSDNPSPGPFEINQSGKQTIKVWPVKR